MSTLATIEDFAAFTGAEIDGTDATAQRMLRMASIFIRSEARETFDLDTEDVQLRGNWTCELQLPRPPVIDVPTVEVRYSGDTAYTALTENAFTFDRMGLLLYPGGYWGGSRGVVHVSYERGYAEVPEPIQSVCLSVAKRLMVFADRYSDQQVKSADAGVSVGMTELEARVIHSYRPVPSL